MQLSIGIVGLPNVGKSTLFNLLTKKEVNIANYPFCTIDPNIGIVSVPDERLDKLATLEQSAKKIPAVVEFYDIAGLVKGANKGEGLGNQFLAHIKKVDAILMVLRCFNDNEVIHVEGKVDPLRDMEIINTELALKDLEVIEKRLGGLEKEIKSGSKEALKEKELLLKIKNPLSRDRGIVDFQGEKKLKDLGLLSIKKRIYLLNGLLDGEENLEQELRNRIEREGGEYVIADLSNKSDEALQDVIKKSYKILGLISFFTAGPKEARAWTIKRGMLAPQAAGVIHSDFEKNFIRAEVINWQKLLDAGSWQKARSGGLIRVEGKNYEIKDGDVVLFRCG